MFTSSYLTYFFQNYLIEWNKKKIYRKRCILGKAFKGSENEWSILLKSSYFNRIRRILVSKIQEGRADMGIDCIIKLTYKIGIILIYIYIYIYIFSFDMLSLDYQGIWLYFEDKSTIFETHWGVIPIPK